MNFMILPHGELKLNSAMDEESKEVAGKFVDELKKLGVLQPAEGELLVNCPLFCVDKSSSKDKRCIAGTQKPVGKMNAWESNLCTWYGMSVSSHSYTQAGGLL
jgi:hypothetical protein